MVLKFQIMDKSIIDAETNELIDCDDSQPTKFELLMKERRELVANEKKPNPLVHQYLEQGPLTPMYNKYWDKVSDTVMLPSIPDGQSGIRSDSEILRPFIYFNSKTNPPPNTPTIDHDLKSVTSTLDSIFSLHEDSKMQSRTSDKLSGHWLTLERIFYIQICKFVEAMEDNKRLTHEPLLTEKQLQHQKSLCKSLARVRMKLLKQIVSALIEEEAKEKQRQKDEKDTFSKIALKRLKDYNEEDRIKSRLYIRRIQDEGARILADKYSALGIGIG